MMPMGRWACPTSAVVAVPNDRLSQSVHELFEYWQKSPPYLGPRSRSIDLSVLSSNEMVPRTRNQGKPISDPLPCALGRRIFPCTAEEHNDTVDAPQHTKPMDLESETFLFQ